MRVLITGGAGFIGRNLTRALLAEGHQVRVLDPLATQVHGATATVPPELAGAEFVPGDIRDPGALAAVLDGIEAVAHLAAETGVGQSMYEINRYVDVNDRGTACLLEALIAYGQPVRLVLASSRAVYGEGLYRCPGCGEVAPPARGGAALEQGSWEPRCPGCGGPLTPIATHEGAPANPGSVYAATKLAQEHLCRIVGAAYGLSVVILRYFNVYGPGQSLSNPYTGILSTFYTRARSGKAIDVFEDGQESRDFVYIDDVVDATRRALIAPEPPPGAAINVGSGVTTTVEELAREVVRLGGWDVPVRVTGAFRVGDVRHAVADPTRARQLLGFTARVSLDEGLRRWLAWAESSEFRDSTETAARQLAERGLFRRAGGG